MSPIVTPKTWDINFEILIWVDFNLMCKEVWIVLTGGVDGGNDTSQFAGFDNHWQFEGVLTTDFRRVFGRR